MPNYCDYHLIVGGRADNVDEFVRIMQNDYDKTHMYRIFEAVESGSTTYGLYKRIDIVGNCAWSVYSCMLPGALSYYNDDYNRHKNNEVIEVWNNKTKEIEKEQCNMDNFLGTNLLELADKLGLNIYCYSFEGGLRFCESYHILPGGIKVLDRKGEYDEYWLEENLHADNTYDTFDEYCDYWGYNKENLPFDEEEYNYMMENNIPVYKNAEFECNMDAIPDKPKYICKKVMYKLVDKNK